MSTDLITTPLAIEVKGEVIASNVAEFRELVTTALASINRSPSTDDEFGKAEQDVKGLKDAEQGVRDAKDKALKDAETLHALFAALDETGDEIRDARLELEKAVKARKEEVKRDLVEVCEKDLEHYDITGVRSELESAIKGKRTLTSMSAALNIAEANIRARYEKTRSILDQFEGEYGKTLILDRSDLEARTPDQVTAELRRRADLKKAEDERKAEREKLQEEADKAKAEIAKLTKPEAPEPLPAPRKIGSIPTGPSPAAEWEGFRAEVMAAFQGLKKSKEALRHTENQERAARFAAGVNEAWKSVAQTSPTP